MEAYFDRFTISMTKAQAHSASHQGRCDDDVAALVENKKMARQLAKLSPDAVREEFREYGAWDDAELSDHSANLRRITWLAAGNIVEDHA